MLLRGRFILIALSFIGIVGCAASVRKPDAEKPIRVGSHADAAIVLKVTGSKTATDSSDWEQFKGIWRQALKDEAAGMHAAFDIEEGEPKPTGTPGTLLIVDISDFRLVSAGARVGLGVMTGNAFVSAHVTFRDLTNGDTWGDQSYDTKSTAWQGVFSAMTEKQVRAICKDVTATLRSSEAAPPH